MDLSEKNKKALEQLLTSKYMGVSGIGGLNEDTIGLDHSLVMGLKFYKIGYNDALKALFKELSETQDKNEKEKVD